MAEANPYYVAGELGSTKRGMPDAVQRSEILRFKKNLASVRELAFSVLSQQPCIWVMMRSKREGK